MNCTVSVRLGKMMIIMFTVIDLAVFRHIQLTFIMHLTVKSDANPVHEKYVSS